MRYKGFTLAETLIVLVILGIIASITIPALIKNHTESSNKTRIKKAMTAYESALNKIIIENNLKSDNSINNWANADCSNTRTYFKSVQNGQNNCSFKTADGVWWNISDIKNPLISLKDEITNRQASLEIAKDTNDDTIFSMVGRMDAQGISRIDDLQYEISASQNSYDEYLAKLYGYINNREYELKYNINRELNKLRNGDFDKLCENPSYRENNNFGSCQNCKGCYIHDTYWNEYRFFDNSGKELLSRRGCTNGALDCNSSNSILYGTNKDMGANFIDCDDYGNCSTCENFYSHNCSQFGYTCEDESSDDYCYR